MRPALAGTEIIACIEEFLGSEEHRNSCTGRSRKREKRKEAAAPYRSHDRGARARQKAKQQQMLNAVEMFNQTLALWKNAVKYAKRHGYEETEIENFKLLENAKWLDKLTVSDYLEGLSDATKVTPMLGRDT